MRNPNKTVIHVTGSLVSNQICNPTSYGNIQCQNLTCEPYKIIIESIFDYNWLVTLNNYTSVDKGSI